jgi:hypothetical protein
MVKELASHGARRRNAISMLDVATMGVGREVRWYGEPKKTMGNTL